MIGNSNVRKISTISFLLLRQRSILLRVHKRLYSEHKYVHVGETEKELIYIIPIHISLYRNFRFWKKILKSNRYIYNQIFF